MLDGMSLALQIIAVRKISHMNIESRGSFVCVGIMDEQRLEVVLKLYHSVGSVVEIGLLQLGC